MADCFHVAEHPQVHCPDPSRKESNVLVDADEAFDPADYHRLFACPEGMVTGEWSPLYGPWVEALGEYARTCPPERLPDRSRSAKHAPRQ